MLAAILSIYLLAILAPVLVRSLGRWGGWVLAILPAAWTIYFAASGAEVGRGSIIELRPWLAGLDIALCFVLDGLSLLMALLIMGIGALVVIFAQSYMPQGRDKGRFYCFLLMFMASMLGLVLADDLIVLFVFWELTSFSSFLLIGHYHERPEARAAALQALIVTAGGGLALLAGIVMIGLAAGSFRISDLLSGGTSLTDHPLYVPTVVLILIGAFSKSAQFPFHFWLPNAMEAPAPVSAYLHAATMVKAGVYLMARLTPVLGGTALWQHSLVVAGGVTMVAASLLSLRQRDAKRLLAYSTVSSLGVMTVLLGMGTPFAIGAAVTFLLAHGMYKGSLFLVAGAIDHATGERNVDRLAGLCRQMPVLTAAAGLAALSMAGLPPLMGFLAKEGFLQAMVVSPWPVMAIILGVTTSAVLTAIALLTGVRPFFGKRPHELHQTHALTASLLVGPVLLAIGGVVTGVIPQLAEPLLASAADAAFKRETHLHLALWHGLNLPLGLSALVLATGVVLYKGWAKVQRLAATAGPLAALGPARLYDAAMRSLVWIAKTQTAVLQSGFLRLYVLLIIGATVVLVGATLVTGSIEMPPDWADVRPHEIVLAGLVVMGAIGAIGSRSWLAAVAALGVTGYAVAAIFVAFGAPDLAMTQFLVETLTVILFVLIIYHLPQLTRIPARRFVPIRLLASLAVGTMASVLVMAAASGPPDRQIADYYLTHALPGGFGRNVVNVILVDFRAIDTLGEITVLGVAAMGVYALVKARRGDGRGGT